MTTVSVLGSGLMATALAFPLSDNGHEVRLIGTHLDREIIDSIKERRVHPASTSRSPGARAFQLEEAEEAFDGADVIMSGGARSECAGPETSCRAAETWHAYSPSPRGWRPHRAEICASSPRCSPGEVPEELRAGVLVGHRRPLHRRRSRRPKDTCVLFTGRDAGVLEEMAGLFRTPTIMCGPRPTSSASRCARRPRTATLSGPVSWRAYSTVRASRGALPQL